VAKIEIKITRKYKRPRTVREMLADLADGTKSREEIEREA
jgi:hypothetical protein